MAWQVVRRAKAAADGGALGPSAAEKAEDEANLERVRQQGRRVTTDCQDGLGSIHRRMTVRDSAVHGLRSVNVPLYSSCGSCE